MRRFRSILAIVSGLADRSAALARAASIADREGAVLKVVRTMADPSEPISLHGLELREVCDRVFEEESKRLEGLVRPYSKAVKAGIRTEILVGRPLVEIAREVIQQGHDLVLVEAPSPGTTGPDGKLGMQLMRKCPCAVWMVHPRERNPYRQVMAAVDLAAGDERKMALNIQIAQLAAALALADSCGLDIVNAWSVYGESLLSVRARLSGSQLVRMRREALRAHRERMEALVSRADLGGVRHAVRLVKGEPAGILVDLAEKQETDILVMGTVARSGVAGVLLGNTAESVAARVGCSVLAVKPEEMISPHKQRAA